MLIFDEVFDFRDCYERGLDWEGCREMMELMLNYRFLCECEMVWRLSDEQVEERLEGRRR